MCLLRPPAPAAEQKKRVFEDAKDVPVQDCFRAHCSDSARRSVLFAGRGKDLHADRFFVKRELEKLNGEKVLRYGVCKVTLFAPCAIVAGQNELWDVPGRLWPLVDGDLTLLRWQARAIRIRSTLMRCTPL